MNNDPIMAAVEELLASVSVDDLEDKPLLQALMNWSRSQDVDRANMCGAMATLLGFFIGMRAEDKEHLRVGLSIYAGQIRAAAKISMEAKQGAVEGCFKEEEP